MDQEVVALAEAASSTLVVLMTTDAWHQARDGVVGIFKRHRPEQAQAVANALDSAKNSRALDDATAHAGAPSGEGVLGDLWRQELCALLSSSPAAVEELRRALEDLAGPSVAGRPSPATPRINVRTKGHGRTYVAGNNQHFHGGDHG